MTGTGMAFCTIATAISPFSYWSNATICAFLRSPLRSTSTTSSGVNSFVPIAPLSDTASISSVFSLARPRSFPTRARAAPSPVTRRSRTACTAPRRPRPVVTSLAIVVDTMSSPIRGPVPISVLSSGVAQPRGTLIAQACRSLSSRRSRTSIVTSVFPDRING